MGTGAEKGKWGQVRGMGTVGMETGAGMGTGAGNRDRGNGDRGNGDRGNGNRCGEGGQVRGMGTGDGGRGNGYRCGEGGHGEWGQGSGDRGSGIGGVGQWTGEHNRSIQNINDLIEAYYIQYT